MNNLQPAGEVQSQNSALSKPWYKKWWGIIIAILFLPLFAIWYVYEKTAWSEKQKGAAILGIVILSIFIYSSDNSTPTTNPTSDSTDQSTEAVESTSVELTTEEKEQLRAFYQELVNHPSEADKAYADWLASLDSTSTTEAYFKLDDVENKFFSAWRGFSEMKAPEVNITEEERKQLKEGLFDLSTAYNTKKNAVGKMQEYLNKNDLEQLSKFREDMQVADQLVLSGLAKILTVMTKYEIDIEIEESTPTDTN